MARATTPNQRTGTRRSTREELETTWESAWPLSSVAAEAVSRFGAAASSCEERACFPVVPRTLQSDADRHPERSCSGMVAEPLN